MNSKNEKLSAPCEIAIEVTGRCNLNCKYCFNENKNLDMPFKKIVNILDQANNMNVFEICFSGGEPFIRNDILKILDYSLTKDFDISIVTNGTLFNSKIIDELNNMELISSVQISIDSSNESIHNSVRGLHSRTLSSLKLIKEKCNQLPVIGLVLHKQNYNSILSTLSELAPYCSGFHLMNVMCTEKSLQNQELLFLDYRNVTKIWKKIDEYCREKSIQIDINDYDLKLKETARFTGCTAGKTKIAITPELNVIPCDMTRNIILGNLKQDTLLEIWNSKQAIDIRNLDIEPCYKLNSRLSIKR